MNRKHKKIWTILLSVCTAIFLTFNFTLYALAQTPFYNDAKISLTFDDGDESVYTKALPILSSRGLKATAYVTTDFVGKSGYMTWDQILSLQNDYGWEIGSHSVSHPDLKNSTLETVIYELVESLNILLSFGLNTTNFASPYGEYDNNVLSALSGIYNSHRTFWFDSNLNENPYNSLEVTTQSVDQTVNLEEIFSRIDQAKAENKWLTLTFHVIAEEPDPDYTYVTTTSDLAAIADHIVSSQVAVANVEESLALPGGNLIVNPSFEEGMNNWTTDNPNFVNIDKDKNGRFPQELSALRLIGGRKKTHVFSTPVVVSNQNSYAFSTFLNTDNLSKGSIEFYIDEYESDGDWISGQWIGYVEKDRVTEFTHLYNPSSESVVNAAVQIYLTKRSRGYVYIDAVKMHNLTGSGAPSPTPTSSPTETPIPTPTATPTVVPTLTPTPKPSVTPTTEPTPTPENLVVNPSFEEVDGDGWAEGWVRQTLDLIVNMLSMGNDGENSVELNTDRRTHLFSQKILVDPGLTYSWSQFVKVIDLGSEFGFYIDEYNENGNWISGQWKGMVNGNQDGVVDIVYTPSGSNVYQIGLQYYNVGGSPSLIYLDSVEFVEN